MNKYLKSIRDKITIDRPKKFSQLKVEESASILRICRFIGDIIGYDSICVETDNADIEFTDKDDYFLEVKTPIFFRQKYGDQHNHIMKQYYELLSARKSRAIASFVRDDTELEIVSDKKAKIPDYQDSYAIIMFDNNYIPTKVIYKKFWDTIDKAKEQLYNINQNGKKIVAIDISYFLIDSEKARRALKEYILYNEEIGEIIDGVCVFCLDPMKRGGNIFPLTIGPKALKQEVKSKVFHQPYKYDLSWNLMTLVTKKFDENTLAIDKLGNIKFNEAYFKDLWETTSKLRKYNTFKMPTDNRYRMGIYY